MTLTPENSRTVTGSEVNSGSAADGTVLTADGSGGSAFEAPAAGGEIDYAEATGNVTVSGTTVGGAQTLVASNSKTYSGTQVVMIEFFAPIAEPGVTLGDKLVFELIEDSTDIGELGQVRTNVVSQTPYIPVSFARRLTPAAGAHVYTVKAYRVGTSNGTVYAAAGGATTRVPMFIRITAA